MMLAMPTVLRQNGFAVMIPVDDHPPPHVHVVKGGHVLIVNLGDGDCEPSIRDNEGMNASDKSKAFRIVSDHRDKLLDQWRKLHG